MKGIYKLIVFFAIPAVILAGLLALHQTALATDQCQVGDRMCVSDKTLKICGDYDSDGDLEWSESYSCFLGQYCSLGKCYDPNINPAPPSCTSECTTGAKKCSGANTYQLCGNYDSDSCLEWSTSYSCPSGQACSGSGVCSVTCSNQCTTPGQWACPSQGAYKICQDTNGDGCLEWSQNYDCQSGFYCSETQKTCLQPADNPTTVSLTANKTLAKTGESVNFVIQANDKDGVEKVCFIDNAFSATPECISCSGNTCQKTFTKTKQTAGLYVFSAYTIAKRAQGGTNLLSANAVSVLFTSPVDVCSDDCSVNGATECLGNLAMKFCGNYDADPCLDWSPSIPCPTGQECSQNTNFCKYPDNSQTSGIIQVSQNSICAGSQYPEITITVNGNDSNGVEKVCYIEGTNGTLNCQSCDGVSSCQKTWTKLLNTGLGTTYFYGKVFGKNPSGGVDTVNTNPEYQKVEIKNCCLNDCSVQGVTECFGNSVRVCQAQSNGCLMWVDLHACGTDTYTDEYRCYNNNNIVQRKIIKKGCSGSACYEKTEWVDYDNCQARGEVCNNSTNRCNSQFLEVSCFAAPSTAKKGEYSWVVARVAGGVGPYQYSWSGDYLGSEQTVYKTFFTKGTYTAYLTVKAGDQTKSASCTAYVSDEIAPYANHTGNANIWVSNTTVYTGETFTISVFGADEDGIDGIEAYYQNSWHNQSASGNSATRNWQITEYTPNRYLYCGKVVGRTLTGSRDISYSNPRCVEVWVRNR